MGLREGWTGNTKGGVELTSEGEGKELYVWLGRYL